MNGDRPIEPHPTSNDGIYRSPDLGEVRGTACLGVMEVIDYPLAPLDKVGWLLIGQFHLRGKSFLPEPAVVT